MTPIKIVVTCTYTTPINATVSPAVAFPMIEHEYSIVVMNADTGEEIASGPLTEITYNVPRIPIDGERHS